MRLTDNRYATERMQFELALRMIRHEARTRTIKACTGLSDDRIRKLYATYFRDRGATTIRRRRGKSPRQVSLFVKNPLNQLEATTLVALFCASLLLHPSARLTFEWAWNLLQTISQKDELLLAECRECRAMYVQDACALDPGLCPSCEIAGHRQRSSGRIGLSRRSGVRTGR